MRSSLFLTWVCLGGSCSAHAQKDTTTLYGIDSPYLRNGKIAYEIPELHAGDTVVEHAGYALLYNERHEQASWVAYELTKKETANDFERTDKFLEDPLVKTGTATLIDYAKSGYDRGHLAPAADMGYSLTTITESFYFSNMSPQVPSFNRGVWKKLEEQVRDWAIYYSAVYVVTGPVLTENLPTIGPNQVSVPAYYYKLVVNYEQEAARAIGFLLPNAASTQPLQSFVVSIDSVEALTGFNFYPGLPVELQRKLEADTCVSCWEW